MGAVLNQAKRIGKNIDGIQKALRKTYVAEAGWFPETGSYDNGATVAQIARIQEYGANIKVFGQTPAVIPPRPFVRPTKAQFGEKYKRFAAGGVAHEIMQKGEPLKPMAQLAERISGDLKKAILDVTEPPLRPLTIELRKRRWSQIPKRKKDIKNAEILEKPLIDTGKLINSTSGKAYTK
jgi:hypothetical protein